MRLHQGLLALGAAMAIAAPASAQFVSLEIENATNLFTPGSTHFGPNQANVENAWALFTQGGANAHTVYRLYAEFLDPNDFLVDIAIFPGSPPLEIEFAHPMPTAPVVYNDADNGVLAPTEVALADPSLARRAFDTFATIGIDVDTGNNQTSWGPFQGNLHTIFDVNADAGLYSADQDTWFVGPGAPQSVVVPGGSTGYRVLIAQFTVSDGTTVSGTLSGQWGTGSFVLGEPELFEFTASFTTASTDCPADVNGDGVVDLNDLNLVLVNFGQETSEGDTNGDGFVDLNDLNAVLVAFGTTCE